MPRLRRVDCSPPGSGRVGRGRGFSYEEADGDHDHRPRGARANPRAGDPAGLEGGLDLPAPQRPHPGDRRRRRRAQAVPLPPAVARGPRPREVRGDGDASQGRCRAMRERTADDLGKRGLVRDRVLACAVRLLDLGFFRIGSERYADENETYGLSTLRRKHVDGRAAAWPSSTTGPRAQATTTRRSPIRSWCRRSSALKDRNGGGYELLAYRERAQRLGRREGRGHQRLPEGGHAAAITRAKDFRTWNATVLAAVELADQRRRGDDARRPASARPPRRPSGWPSYLSNTPAVCRKAYIDPRVFDRYDSRRDDPHLAQADRRRHRPGRVRRPRADRARGAAAAPAERPGIGRLRSVSSTGGPEPLLGLEHRRGALAGRVPGRLGRVGLARLEQRRRRAPSTAPPPRRRARASGRCRLREEARVHEPEVPAAGAAALDHLVVEARAPLPVLDLLRPLADLGGEAAQGGQALVVAQRRLEHLRARCARSPAAAAARIAELGVLGHA